MAENGLLVSFHDHNALTRAISQLLANQSLGRHLRESARRIARLELDINLYHARFAAIVEEILLSRYHVTVR